MGLQIFIIEDTFNDIFPKLLNNAKRKNELVCFLFMDIDHFKQYNDNYGHQKGDDVLISFAKCLKIVYIGLQILHLD